MKSPEPKSPRDADKADRLKAALRANLQRRTAQARARSDGTDGGGIADGTGEEQES